MQSSRSSASVLKNIGRILAIRYRFMKQALRPGSATSLNKQAVRIADSARATLAVAFHCLQHAMRLCSDFEDEHALTAVLARELDEHAISLLQWLKNAWLVEHCSPGLDIDRAVKLAMNSLLGAPAGEP